MSASGASMFWKTNPGAPRTAYTRALIQLKEQLLYENPRLSFTPFSLPLCSFHHHGPARSSPERHGPANGGDYVSPGADGQCEISRDDQTAAPDRRGESEEGGPAGL